MTWKELDLTSYSHWDSHLSLSMIYLIDRRREEVYFLFQSMFYLKSDRDCNLQSRVDPNWQSDRTWKEVGSSSYSHWDSHLSSRCHIWLTGGEKKYISYSNLCSIWFQIEIATYNLELILILIEIPIYLLIVNQIYHGKR
jgi:hypothetical protein